MLLVINKPACIHSASLPKAKDKNPSIADLLRSVYPALENVSTKPEDAGLLNRLDFETSGILLAAKTKESWLAMKRLLLDGSISKSYLALVEGKVQKKMMLQTYLGHHLRNAKKVKVYQTKPRGKVRALPAKTSFELVTYFQKLDVSLIRVFASPARRHQIRAHADFLKHALIGDVLYGSKRPLSSVVNTPLKNGQKLPPFFLHAETVAFKHPTTKKLVRIVAPVSDVFLKKHGMFILSQAETYDRSKSRADF